MQFTQNPGVADGHGIFHPQSFTLPNGMQVVLIENHRSPVVTHMVWFRVGSADDPAGHSGIAHFFEHLMFKGTKKIAAGEISRIIARNGGDDNAFTSYDYTAYYSNIAVDRLPLIMELEADRMENLALDPEIVKTERDVVLEERKQVVESDPIRRMQEKVYAALFPGLPYGTPVIGWQHEIAQLDKTQADYFYGHWYAPNNAILVVSGDITMDALRPLAEQYYGPLKQKPVPLRVRKKSDELPTPQRIEVKDKDVQLPMIKIAYVAPSYGTAKNNAPYALQIADEIMGAGASSRLYKELVMKQQIASSVGMYYTPTSIADNAWVVYGAPVPGGDIAAVEAALHAELARAVADGFTEDEVTRAKKRMIAEATYARDSVRHPAYLFGMALTTGQELVDVEAWPERIAAVTPAEVNDAAREVLNTKNCITGILLPEVNG
jgi:zinc protease